MANNIAAGGQLSYTTDVENFPGFPEGIMGYEITDKFRAQSQRFGTIIHTETVDRVDLSKSPYKITTSDRSIEAKTVIIATGAIAKRLIFKGSETYWNNG